MISPKKLIKMARKWQRAAAIRRKRISLPGITSGVLQGTAPTRAVKDHFVVYTLDHKRFVLPIAYLSSNIFKELLALSEEVFGLPGNGPITLPCDSVFMNYAANLIRHQETEEDIERALLRSMANYRSSLSCHLNRTDISQQLLPCVF